MKIKIQTKHVLEELQYKVHIICDEPDMRKNYGVTKNQVGDLYDRLMYLTSQVAECAVVIEVTEKEARMIKGEMEYLLEANERNYCWYKDREPDSVQASIAKQSVKDLKKFLKQFPKV